MSPEDAGFGQRTFRVAQQQGRPATQVMAQAGEQTIKSLMKMGVPSVRPHKDSQGSRCGGPDPHRVKGVQGALMSAPLCSVIVAELRGELQFSTCL